MKSTPSEGERAELVLLAFAVVGWALATVHLMLLFWRFVPMQRALFEGMNASPSAGFRLAVLASDAMVRTLPFLVMAAPFVVGALAVGGGLLAWWLDLTTRTVRRMLIAVALAGAASTMLVSFGVVHSAQGVLDRANIDPRLRAP